jgi:TM2 domain-containing membrane protein YozV
MVKNSLAGLPAAKQEEFMEEYKRRAKSVAGAYLCQFLGAHYFYLRKSSTAWMFWLTGGGLFCWWFIDLFRIPKMVTDYNRDIATDIIRTVKILS